MPALVLKACRAEGRACPCACIAVQAVQGCCSDAAMAFSFFTETALTQG